MFLCKECGEQFEDNHLAYTVVPENRLSHPMVDAFIMKFCSKAHVQQFLDQIRNQQMPYVLTRLDKGVVKRFEPNFPLELRLLVGSSKAS